MSTIKKILLSLLSRCQNFPFLHYRLIKLYSLFYPLPFQDPLMEFRYGVWGGISTIRCVEGRPLGETNSTPPAFRHKVPTHFHPANLDGSRVGYSINLTALQHIMRLWPELLAFIGCIRQEFKVRFKIDDRPLCLLEIYLFSMISISIPAFLARRNDHPLQDKQIASIIADQQKLITGIFMIVRDMLEKGMAASSLMEQWSAEQIYDYADNNELFLAPNGAKTACGGSRRKIIEFINFIIHGNSDPPLTVAAQNSIDAIGNFSHLFDYASKTLALEFYIPYAKLISFNALSNTRHTKSHDLCKNQLAYNINHKIYAYQTLLKAVGNIECADLLESFLKEKYFDDLLTFKINLLLFLQSQIVQLQKNILISLGKESLPDIPIDLINQKIGILSKKDFFNLKEYRNP